MKSKPRIPPIITPIAEGDDTANSIWYRFFDQLLEYIVNGFPDAPNDGNQYGRQNLAWTIITHDEGIPEAPIDGNQYGRQDAAWTVIQSGAFPEAPIDGIQYGRQNAAWTPVPLNNPVTAIDNGIVALLAVNVNSGQLNSIPHPNTVTSTNVYTAATAGGTHLDGLPRRRIYRTVQITQPTSHARFNVPTPFCNLTRQRFAFVCIFGIPSAPAEYSTTSGHLVGFVSSATQSLTGGPASLFAVATDLQDIFALGLDFSSSSWAFYRRPGASGSPTVYSLDVSVPRIADRVYRAVIWKDWGETDCYATMQQFDADGVLEVQGSCTIPNAEIAPALVQPMFYGAPSAVGQTFVADLASAYLTLS